MTAVALRFEIEGFKKNEEAGQPIITPHDISSADVPFRAGEKEKPSEEGSA